MLAVLKGSETGWVFLAGLGLAGALLPDAVLGRDEGDSSGSLFNALLASRGIDAMVMDKANHVMGSVRFFSLLKTFFPAAFGSIASVITELKGSNASSIIFTSLFFLFAVFFNTFLRIFQGKSNSCFLLRFSDLMVETMVLSTTFHNIGSSIIFLS